MSDYDERDTTAEVRRDDADANSSLTHPEPKGEGTDETT